MLNSFFFDNEIHPSSINELQTNNPYELVLRKERNAITRERRHGGPHTSECKRAEGIETRRRLEFVGLARGWPAGC